ncbi:MAG: PPC domain-containing protein, partial [Limisphaerales bacterium]
MLRALKYVLLLMLVCAIGSAAIAAPKKPKKMQKPKVIGDKPDITRFEPRGVQNGIEIRVRLIGTNFVDLTEIKTSNPKLIAKLDGESDEDTTEAWMRVKAASDLSRGGYDISVVNAKGESAKVKLYVDEIPQAQESTNTKTLKLPVAYWGTLNPAGDLDEVQFEARAGQSLVLDLSTKTIGSKADAMIALFDPHGTLIEANSGFDGPEPLIAFTAPKTGRYKVQIKDTTATGSPEHTYRLTVGELPVVVGMYPLSTAVNQDRDIQLIGYNLHEAKVHVKPMKAGDMDLPVDMSKFRVRRSLKLLATDGPELAEVEPNDTPGQATRIPVPGTISGRIWSATGNDTDLYRFKATAGQSLVIETDAARRGSPIDTKIEVLYGDGKPVERAQLQSVRDSAITFKDIDSRSPDIRVENWQEMELNQYLYMGGEVCKIFRMPEGPDSGFQLYQSGGKRRDYFDSSASGHALDSPCYIVEAHPSGEKLVPNGLPVFPIVYANDDDGERELGTDSRLQFVAPADGEYLVRVTDTRGYYGERFAYRLTIRESRPDFKVTLKETSPSVGPGSGQQFSVAVDRIDGFDNDIVVDFQNVPAGFKVSTPLTIQAGHLEARGTINAATNAVEPTPETVAQLKVTAKSKVGGKELVKEVNHFEKIKLGDKPKMIVAAEPYSESSTNLVARTIADPPQEITIGPGQVIPIWLKVRRTGFDDVATFTAENLPHGVIVDN